MHWVKYLRARKRESFALIYPGFWPSFAPICPGLGFLENLSLLFAPAF